MLRMAEKYIVQREVEDCKMFLMSKSRVVMVVLVVVMVVAMVVMMSTCLVSWCRGLLDTYMFSHL